MTRHPAKFTDDLLPVAFGMLAPALDVVGRLVEHEPRATVLDPFAGTGKGVDYLNRTGYFDALGIELEPEWASQSSSVIVGSALALPFPADTFDAVFTSPCYGNRMADSHNARDVCKRCDGTGFDPESGDVVACRNCRGEKLSRRNTYKAALGRHPSDESAAVMQWGSAYREFHVHAWLEATRVVKPGGFFLLNIKDHVRAKQVVEVSGWHARKILSLGWTPVGSERVACPGNRQGENGAARVDHENLILFRKDG